MPTSPEEWENKRFLVALRGYDKDQVDAFIREIAEEHRQLLQAFEAHAGASDPQDPFTELGEQVAVIARAATDAA
ncbi:MAG TPA: DivIVA domain-containing protein, partial [Acidimicrobiales bacterium]|nr:DivIVA domain-containing protein [Acidimicrobiales bacterium]